MDIFLKIGGVFVIFLSKIRISSLTIERVNIEYTYSLNRAI